MFDNPYLDGSLLVFTYMNIAFVVAMVKRDNSIVDALWGLGFVLLACWMEWFHPRGGGLFLPFAVTIWGLRLFVHLFLRNIKKGEDWRYAEWRRQWGRWVLIRSYFQVFILQGFFMFIISLPLMDRGLSNEGLHWTQALGMVVWAVGFLWEAVADWQLARFKADGKNAGKIMSQGLWKFSRHPNYFGEMLVWWGIFLYTIPQGNVWLNLVSPVVITWLLTKVSGVPMLERKYRGNPEYLTYKKTTNAFFPWRKRQI